MSIRLPLKSVLDYDDAGNVGAGSVAGAVAKTFNLPQDCDNILVKYTASIVGGGAQVALQTTDDGGTTWYEIARSSVVSNANGTTAEWISAGTQSNAYVGKASVAAAGATNSIPVLSPFNRVIIQYGAAVSANAKSRIQVMTNSQSASSN